MQTLTEIDVNAKRVLIRVDLNVPLENGNISNDKRIQAVLPTLQLALEKGAAVILLSHLGRPKEGQYDPNLSLAPVAQRLTTLLQLPVRLEKNYLKGIEIQPGEVMLCENVRFNVGEKKDDATLAQRYAALADVFVMDAFATAHRAQASTHGVAKYSKIACAGPLLVQELHALSQALKHPKKPMMAIVGGAKVSTKLGVLAALIDKVDVLIVGGGMANTFLNAQGIPIGQSLCEPELSEQAQRLMAKAKAQGVSLPLLTDVVVAKTVSSTAAAVTKPVTEIAEDEMILDIGPKTRKDLIDRIATMKTIIWNGPVGVFEFEQFAQGTRTLALALAVSPAFTLAGGGDTLAAIDRFNIAEKIDYISTGGGAFLEFIEGKTLPGVAVLDGESHAKAH